MSDATSEPSKQSEGEPEDGSLSEILDEIEGLDPEEQKTIAQFFFERRESTLSSFTSPLPPPSILREYNELIPNGADCLMTMAENQARHRIRIESIVIQGDTRRSYIGLWLGFFVALLVLLTAMYAIYAGEPVLAGAIVTIDLIALSSVFVYGSITRRIERQCRRKAIEAESESSEESEPN